MARTGGKKSLVAVWCLVLIFGLSAITPVYARTKIQFGMAIVAANAPEYVAAVDAFNASHPDMEVEYYYVGGTSVFKQKVMVALAGGTPFDTFYLNDRDVPTMALAGTMAPLDGIAARDPSLDLNGIFPGSLNSGRYNGILYGLPYYYGPHYLYFNKNLFNANGVAYPTLNTTYDEAARSGKRLTKDTNGDGINEIFGLFIQTNLGWLDKLIYSFGGTYFNSAKTRIQLSDLNTITAFRWYYDYAIQQLQVAPPDTSGSTLFPVGKLGMMFSYRGNPQWVQMEDIDIGMSATPRGPMDQYMSAPSAVVAMSPGLSAEKSKVAWEFIKWMASDEIQSSTLVSKSLPVTRRAFISNFRQYLLPWEDINVLMYVAVGAHPAPVAPAWASIESVNARYFKQVINGQISVQEALVHVEEEANVLWQNEIAQKG